MLSPLVLKYFTKEASSKNPWYKTRNDVFTIGEDSESPQDYWVTYRPEKDAVELSQWTRPGKQLAPSKYKHLEQHRIGDIQNSSEYDDYEEPMTEHTFHVPTSVAMQDPDLRSRMYSAIEAYKYSKKPNMRFYDPELYGSEDEYRKAHSREHHSTAGLTAKQVINRLKTNIQNKGKSYNITKDPDVPANSAPSKYPKDFLRQWGPGVGNFIGYKIPITKEAAKQQDGSGKSNSSNMRRNLAIGGGLLALAGLGLGARKYLRKAPAKGVPGALPIAPKPVRTAANTVQAAPVVNPRIDYRDHVRRVGRDMGLDEDEFYNHFSDFDDVYDGDMIDYFGDLPDYLKKKGVAPTDFVNRFIPSWNKHFPDSHQIEEFASPIGSPFDPGRAYVPGREVIGSEFVAENVHPGIRSVSNKYLFFPEGVNTKRK